MKTINSYECDFCNKYSKSKAYMKRHEKICFHNPVTKSCVSCKNLTGSTLNLSTTEFTLRPVCVAGINISEINPTALSGYTHDLRTGCSSWEQRITEEEE